MLGCTGIQTDLTPGNIYINSSAKIVEKELWNYIKTETATLIIPGKDAFTAA